MNTIPSDNDSVRYLNGLMKDNYQVGNLKTVDAATFRNNIQNRINGTGTHRGGGAVFRMSRNNAISRSGIIGGTITISVISGVAA